MPSGFWRVRCFRRRLEAGRFPGRDSWWISPPVALPRQPARCGRSRLFPPPPGNFTFPNDQVSPHFGWNDATIGFKVVSGDRVPEQGRGPNTRSVEWLLTVM